jgi:hypothetical protein
MKTIREQEEQRRRSKLEGIRRQVRSGKLVVRQMTAGERAQFPPSQQDRSEKSRP